MFPLAHSNPEAGGAGWMLAREQRPCTLVHCCARSCTLFLHSLLFPLVFFQPFFSVGPGRVGRTTAPGGGYQHQQLLGNSTWTPRNWRIQLIPALPQALSGLSLGWELACFSSAEIRSQAGKKRTWLFIFYPCSCIMLHIVLRYLLLGGCFLAVCTSVPPRVL